MDFLEFLVPIVILVFLAVVALAFMSAQRERERMSEDRDKTCPECAETVKADARACRFCGHRFSAGPV